MLIQITIIETHTHSHGYEIHANIHDAQQSKRKRILCVHSVHTSMHFIRILAAASWIGSKLRDKHDSIVSVEQKAFRPNTTDIRIDATFDHFQLGFHFDDDDKHLHACGHFSFFCIRSIEWNLRISDSSTETHFSITTAQHIRNQNCFGFKLNERKTKRTKKRIWLWRLTAMRLNESKTQPTQLDSARIQNRVSNK